MLAENCTGLESTLLRRATVLDTHALERLLAFRFRNAASIAQTVDVLFRAVAVDHIGLEALVGEQIVVATHDAACSRNGAEIRPIEPLCANAMFFVVVMAFVAAMVNVVELKASSAHLIVRDAHGRGVARHVRLR